MKKIYFSMMAIAIAAFTFTACEDVPEPYNNPYDQLKNNTGGITGDNLLTNGDFETWTNGQPDNWKSTNTASSATLSQSTEAHGGSYSVKVAHDANGNKRLAYKELKLKAGSYGVSFFVRASEATASINPGYTTVTDKVNYNYNGYVNDITTEWQQVSYNFTLSAETEVNLVVMVPKNSAADAIIDDFTLVTSDGGIVDGGNDTPATPDTPDTDAIFSESFANGQGNFTIDDKVLSGIWTAGSYGSDKYMMATSYIKLDGESAKANHDAESWLVSPEIDLTNATSAVLKFSEVINSYFGNVNDEAKVYAKAENGEWTALSFTRAEKPSKGYTKFTDATANISIDLNAYKGGKMQFAFVYKGTATAAGTWEVKDIKIVPAAQ